jgi:transcriptional regulator with XRE-family HTH domain
MEAKRMADKEFLKRLRVAVAMIGKQKDAAAAIGITDARLSNYLRGVNKPGSEILANLAAEAKVRPAWLIDGVGPMVAEAEIFRPAIAPRQPSAEQRPEPRTWPGPVPAVAPAAPGSPAAPGAQQMLQAVQVLLTGWLQSAAPAAETGAPRPAEVSPPAPGPSSWKAGKIISRDDYEALPPAKRKHFVPILVHSTGGLAAVCAGQGLAREAAEEYVLAPGAPEGTFAARITGNSMLPDFPDGSVVLVGAPVEPLPDLSLPALVVYEDKMGTIRHTVKVVTAEGSTVHLRPLNPEFGGHEPIPRACVRAVFGIVCRQA